MGVRPMTGNKGFTLFEMLIVVAIMGVIALAAVPVAEIAYVKTQENQLQESLEQIRGAIKLYMRDCKNAIKVNYNTAESEYYPRELHDLVTPPATHDVEDRDGNPVGTFYPTPYLTKIPIDPFVGAPVWATHAVNNGAVATYPYETMTSKGGRGIFDVSVATLSAGVRKGFINAIDGTDYRDW